MKFIKLFHLLFQLKLLTPVGLYQFIQSLNKYSINLFVILFFAKKYDKKIALVDDHDSITYDELFIKVEQLAIELKLNYDLKKGQRVAFLCRNHIPFIKMIFACSRLGLDLSFIHPDKSKAQIISELKETKHQLIIHDHEFEETLVQTSCFLSRNLNIEKITLFNTKRKGTLKKTSSGRLILLTGGTTGKSRQVAHQPSLFNYLNPLITLIQRLNLLKYNTAYISTPIFHGYGLSVLFVFLLLGKKIVITRKFEASRVSRLIKEYEVEMITAVPLIVKKLLMESISNLKSVRCIATGSAPLNSQLVNQVTENLGHVLYNLYGSSETGLNTIASPEDLEYSPRTIGKKIDGVRAKILNDRKLEVDRGEVGELYFKNKWAMHQEKNKWIATGDLGYMDQKGLFYLCGRTDEMIISAGENVYPQNVEEIISRHPAIIDVAVVGVTDENFGERLIAYVQIKDKSEMNIDDFSRWLRPLLAKYEWPKNIVFMDTLPYTPIGKVDKKQLLKEED